MNTGYCGMLAQEDCDLFIEYISSVYDKSAVVKCDFSPPALGFTLVLIKVLDLMDYLPFCSEIVLLP